MNYPRIGKYLEVHEQPAQPERKTHRWWLLSKSSGLRLGVISWYGPWRGYCFEPYETTVFNSDCLRDIAAFCVQETEADRRKAR